MIRMLPQGVRGRVTLTTGLAALCAMVLVVSVMGYATHSILEDAVRQSLSERLAQACELVEAGDYDAAVDAVGNDVVQVIDANGEVVAGSRKARGLVAIAVLPEGELRVDDFEFERGDDVGVRSSTAGYAENTEKTDAGKQSKTSTKEEGTAASDSTAGGNAKTPARPDGGTGSGTNGLAAEGGGASAVEGEGGGGSAPSPGSTVVGEGNDVDDSSGSRDGAAEQSDSSAGSDEASEGAVFSDGGGTDGGSGEDAGGSDESVSGSGAIGESAGDGGSVADEGGSTGAGSAAAVSGGSTDASSTVADGSGSSSADASTTSSNGNDSETSDDGASDSSATENGSKLDSSGADKVSVESPGSQTQAKQQLWIIARGPFQPTMAWADEPTDLDRVNAASVFGDEGPYLIEKKQVESPDGLLSVIAMTSLAQAERSTRTMQVVLASIMAALLAVIVAMTWFATGRILQPVECMRAQASAIDADNLGERIAVPERDRDLGPLATTLNKMLDRVQTLLEDQKRFTSDASHELKSPLAATAVILDSLKAHPESIDMKKAIDDLSSENMRMASIVGDMLTLTRYDEGRLNCKPEPVDLFDLILEEVAVVGTRATVAIDAQDVQPVVCKADAGLLAHAVRNLLENAARYAKTTVKVSCREDGSGHVLITVSDDGRGITPQDRERVFGRFVRLDQAPTGVKGGTGLGLPVVRSAVEAHGGTVAFTEPEMGGATALITLPVDNNVQIYVQ